MANIPDKYYGYGCQIGYSYNKYKERCVENTWRVFQEERPKVSFESGKPVCSSGAAFQDTSSVQKPDGTWTTVSTGSWRCPYAPKKPTLVF